VTGVAVSIPSTNNEPPSAGESARTTYRRLRSM
jgi:hypothetical protein